MKRSQQEYFKSSRQEKILTPLTIRNKTPRQKLESFSQVDVFAFGHGACNISEYVFDKFPKQYMTCRAAGSKTQVTFHRSEVQVTVLSLVTDPNNSPRSKTAFWIVIRAGRHFWACLFICSTATCTCTCHLFKNLINFRLKTVTLESPTPFYMRARAA